MAQNQPPLHYPAMLNPYPIYKNPVPVTSSHLQAYLITFFLEGCLFLCNRIPKGNMKRAEPNPSHLPSGKPQTLSVCNDNLCSRSNMDFSTCFRDPFEALKPGLISYYLPHGREHRRKPWLSCLALKVNPLLKREALSHENTQKPKTAG